MTGRTTQNLAGPSSELTSFTGEGFPKVEAPKVFTVDGDARPDAPAGAGTRSTQVLDSLPKCASDNLFGRTIYLQAYSGKDVLRVQPQAHSIATIRSGDAFTKHMKTKWESDLGWQSFTPATGRFHWIHLPVNDFDSMKVQLFVRMTTTTDSQLTAYQDCSHFVFMETGRYRIASTSGKDRNSLP